MRLVSLPVAGGAYRIQTGTPLTHIVELGCRDEIVRVFCRVRKSSILDDGCMEREPEVATCPRCQERLARVRSAA